jgi:hypothetical protein
MGAVLRKDICSSHLVGLSPVSRLLLGLYFFLIIDYWSSYLPPPVLDILNNKQLEAAKRAAMITTALKWLLDRIPIKLFPPQFQPIIMMLKRLAPYLGYIGVFIAWSWGAIKAFDKGTARKLGPLHLIH